ncbi:MAG: DedA family protein [Thermomicrobiales bacterium]
MNHAVVALIAHHGMSIVALMVFVAELGLPTGVSPKVALVVVGSTAVGSVPALAGALALVTAANRAGSTSLHLAARTSGGWFAGRVLRRRDARRDGLLGRCRKRLGGRDAATVFVLRLVPLVRIYATVATALAGMPVRRFVLGAAPAALIWSGTPLALGFWFRADAHRLADRAPLVSVASALLLPIVGLGLVVTRRLRSSDRAPRRAPIIGG